MARKLTDTRYIYRHMATREASGVEGGQGGGLGEGTARNSGGATTDVAAATHAAAGGGEMTQGAAQREWRDVTACNDTCKRLARGLEVAKYGAVVGGAGGAREGRKRGRGGGGGGPRVRTRAARRRGEVESSGPGAD